MRMFHFSDDGKYANITLKLNKQLLLYLVRAFLFLTSCYLFLQLILETRDNVLWGVNNLQGLDNSLVKRKLLNVNNINNNNTNVAHETTSTKKQSRADLMQKLHKHKRGVRCSKIFDRNLTVPWTSEQAKRYAKFQEYLEENVLEPLKAVNYSIEGNSGKYPDQWRFYYEFASLNFVSTICETGFNAGHSAFMWLNVNPDVHVYSFDIALHRYTKLMAEALQSMFPGRLHVFYGDSRLTVPRFRRRNPHVTCDMAVVDGGHHEDIPKRDMDNFNLMTKSVNNILILDDWPGLEDVNVTIGNMWRQNIAAKRVMEVFYCMKDRSYWKNGITIGQYI